MPSFDIVFANAAIAKYAAHHEKQSRKPVREKKPPVDPQVADNQRVPGEMSREEARELLDSVKGDEHQSLTIPWAQRGAVQPPDKPFKNW